MNEIIRKIEAEQMKENAPEFNVGDTVKVYAKIKEGNRERIQVFEGTVLKKQGGGVRATFTVRKFSNGIGVEKTWPIHSPHVEKVEVVRRGKVRRAKLNYLRSRMRHLKFRKKRKRAPHKAKLHFLSEKIHWNKKAVALWIAEIAVVCALAFILVFYFGQRVSNAGDSMRPELKNGDVVLVNRLVYNAMTPKRGDIIAFKPNGRENAHYYIKRIVGLPGETVQIKDGKVYINGKEQKKDIFVSEIEKPGVAQDEITLGENEYFVLGDQASSSNDSRMADIGNVKRSEIYGKIWFDTSVGSNFGFVK